MTTSYEVSKIILNDVYIGKNHVQNSRLKESHSTANDFKLAVDIIFLSVLTNKAKDANDTDTYNKALSELNKAIGYLNSKVSTDEAKYKDVYNHPGTPIIFQASIMVKKFNMDYLTETRKSQIEYLYNSTKAWCVSAYNSQTNKNGKTVRYNVENMIADVGLPNRGVIALNSLALNGGAFALDSLFFHDGLPATYPYRNDISNMGNYIKFFGFGDSTKGRLSYIGAGDAVNDATKRVYVDTGYLSWHALGLTLMAHGTTHAPIESRPSSILQTEAELINKGFKTVYDILDYIPQKWKEFGLSPYGADVREYLYTLAVTGDQSTVDWIDSIQTTSGNGIPKVARIAIIDENQGDTGEADFHRIVHALAFGMLKNVNFS